MEREKLIFVGNSHNVYVGGVGESLQRNCRERLLKATPKGDGKREIDLG